MTTDTLHSYPIFMFPFKWNMKSRKDLSFSERTSISRIQPSSYSAWENIATPKTENYKRELYNEKNFFYPFTHHVLYAEDKKDNSIQHYERIETYEREITYNIHVVSGNDKMYSLKVRSIGLNLYETGVGVLMFYLENHQYSELNDILRINQFGRRIYPPFISVEYGISGTKQAELANSIGIEGLNGNPIHYFEDFEAYSPDSLWKPARFIGSLINDFSDDLNIEPVIDDRMFVVCWFGNDELSNRIKTDYQQFIYEQELWYQFLFVDGGYTTCQNDDLRKSLIKKHTYERWQKEGSMYGLTRYSLVFLSNNSDFSKDILLRTFRTMYARIAELSLVQRASVLKFSDEITTISKDEKKTSLLVNNISQLYKKYIHFVNKVYFREITAQEQGIEIYDRLQEVMKIKDHVDELDNDIEELHSYLTILEDRGRSANIEILTIISLVIIIPTLIDSFYTMSARTYWLPILFVPLAALIIYIIRYRKTEGEKTSIVYWVFIIFLLILFLITFITSR